MKRHFGFWPALVLAMLVVTPHVASAAFTRSILTTGVSTSPGTCSITIEPFGIKGGGIHGSAVETFNVNVPIPNASPPSNTSVLIRNALTGALPGEYTVTIPAGHPDWVDITRATGTFTMTITEDVADQTIREAVRTPALGGIGMALLATVLLAWGLRVARRRRSRA